MPVLQPFNIPNAGAAGERLQHMLHAVRKHLGMDVGFVSEFKGGRRYFRNVDAESENPPIVVGGSDPLDETYCEKVVNGVLPELIQDAANLPEAAEMPITRAAPVGAHVSAPIRVSNGSIYGTLCCVSHKADYSLNERDINLLKLFAEVAGQTIEEERAAGKAMGDKIDRIERVIARREFTVVYQPIIRLSDKRLVGFEALTRFTAAPLRSPDQWFAEAAEVGLGADLELATAQDACLLLLSLSPELSLGLNFSPSSILDPRFTSMFEMLPVNRLFLEVTEHAVVENYGELLLALASFRERGLRLAVDDAGAGYASFKHVLDLKPDLIKLDTESRPSGSVMEAHPQELLVC